MRTTYITSVATFGPTTDPKRYIADSTSRRRMSRLIKMGVCAGMESLEKAGLERPDAIVCATGYGFLADSEKFLRAMIETGGEQMPPTPFMQSTFNTIGSHLAIMTQCHGYNMTYAHRADSFPSAMVDALMLIEEGSAEDVLVVAADELTPTLDYVLTRMGERRRGVGLSEGATAFVVSSRESPSALATVGGWGMTDAPSDIPLTDEAYPTAVAERFARAIGGHVDGDFAMGRLKLTLRCG